MFYVVQLDSDVLKEKIVVPSVWLDKSNTLCLLPPTPSAEIESLAKAQASPKHGWKMHDMSFIQSFDTYSQAEENIKINKTKPITVELEEEEGDRKKRKRKRPSFLGSYSIETDNDEEGSRATREFCFVESNLSHIDTSIVKVEMADNSSSLEPKRQRPDTTNDNRSSNCSFLHENNPIMSERSSSNAIDPSVSINMKCPCNSTCHKLIFQSLDALKKHMDDNNRLLYQIMTQFTTQGSTLNTIPGSPINFPVTLPVREMRELQTLDIYLSNQRNFAESIPYFTTFGGSQPRQILKRIMEALLSRDLSSTMNWKGRGDKTPFNTYTKIHSFVHHVAKQNPRATHVTLTEVENFMKDWLKVAPLKQSKSFLKKDLHQ